jgi:hypothetical protein
MLLAECDELVCLEIMTKMLLLGLVSLKTKALSWAGSVCCCLLMLKKIEI